MSPIPVVTLLRTSHPSHMYVCTNPGFPGAGAPALVLLQNRDPQAPDSSGALPPHRPGVCMITVRVVLLVALGVLGVLLEGEIGGLASAIRGRWT